MKEVGAFEAKNRLETLLDWVEQGEQVVITRRGKPVARLVPHLPGIGSRASQRGRSAHHRTQQGHHARRTQDPRPDQRRPAVSVVLDSSVTLSWYFEDERTPEAAAVLHQVAQAGAVVPGLWRLEVANGLQMAVRRWRITTNYRDASLSDLGSLAITTDPETDHHTWDATVRLADRFRLTVYDAAYLELAQRRHLPLATLDAPLRSVPPSAR